MARWSRFAGLADKHRKRPFHIVFANPFPHSESVYPKIVETLKKHDLDRRPRNFTFHRQTTHPTVQKDGPNMAPGWNHSNTEISARQQNGCYVIFDRRGRLVFQGRLTFEEVEEMVDRLLGER